MAKKSTIDKLNKPAKIIISFGGDRKKLKFDRLSEVFAQVKENSTIERALIQTARKQLNY
jgi:acetoin utilization deacetylase AcuC-like enzyme